MPATPEFTDENTVSPADDEPCESGRVGKICRDWLGSTVERESGWAVSPGENGPVGCCFFQKASVMRKAVAVGRKLGLTPEAAKTLAELRTPERIQDFINDIPWNTEPDGETARSVAEVLRLRQAHCVEGAFVAACAFWLAGRRPLLMDMGASEEDVDHVVALFRRGRYWGAISKSNSPSLRYRDPIYRTLRALSLSFFPQYVLERQKTLRTYSVSIDLRRYDPAIWVTQEGYCLEMLEILTSARHFELLPEDFEGQDLRPIDTIEAQSNRLTEHAEPRRIIRLDDHRRPPLPPDRAVSSGR